MTLKVLICGGGNGAHVLTAITAANVNMEARVFTRNSHKAKHWNDVLEQTPLTCSFIEEERKIQSKPKIVTDDPSTVVPDADIVIITVPAFSHEMYLKAIEPFIRHPTILVGLPGQPGFDFQSRSILKHKLDLITILSCQTLPWTCRIVEYGKEMIVRGTKTSINIATISSPKETHSSIKLLQGIIGFRTTLIPAKHFLELDLMCIVMHPGIIYGKWNYWDGRPLLKKPLFYQGADDEQAECIERLSQEVLHTANALSEKFSWIDMTGCMSMFEWVVTSYGSAVKDQSSMKTSLLTNTAYEGFDHPMVSTIIQDKASVLQEGFVPDLKHRYLSEDIPFGLVVIKGLAQLVGVETPVTDKVITWAQGHLDKEYIVGKKLNGRHIGETRAPQAYGITSLDRLKKFVKGVGESGVKRTMGTNSEAHCSQN